MARRQIPVHESMLKPGKGILESLAEKLGVGPEEEPEATGVSSPPPQPSPLKGEGSVASSSVQGDADAASLPPPPGRAGTRGRGDAHRPSTETATVESPPPQHSPLKGEGDVASSSVQGEGDPSLADEENTQQSSVEAFRFSRDESGILVDARILSARGRQALYVRLPQAMHDYLVDLAHNLSKTNRDASMTNLVAQAILEKYPDCLEGDKQVP